MQKLFKLATTTFCLLVIIGCQQNATPDKKESSHDHGHEHVHSNLPKTFNAAILKVRELSDKFSSAMESDDTEAAHDPLHDLGRIIESIPDLAADTDLPEAEWEKIKEDSERLFEAYRGIDSVFHKKDGDKQAAFENAKSAIEESIKALEKNLPPLDGEESDVNHDHEHDDDPDEVHDHDHDHKNEHSDGEMPEEHDEAKD